MPDRGAQTEIVETDIPARLDRLPWARFHTLVVVALGVTWILDGLEVTLAGTLSGALRLARVHGLGRRCTACSRVRCEWQAIGSATVMSITPVSNGSSK